MSSPNRWRLEEARLTDALRRMGIPMRHSLARGGLIVTCKHQNDISRDVLAVEDLAKTMAETE